MKSPKIVALIPVREGSERIRNKNIVNFAGCKSLLDIKIDHLKQAECFDCIYISSDSDRAKQIAKEKGILLMMGDQCAIQRELAVGEAGEAVPQGTVEGVSVGCFPDLYAALAPNPPDQVISL